MALEIQGTFSWDPALQPSLHNLHLEVTSGQLVAVVGTTGNLCLLLLFVVCVCVLCVCVCVVCVCVCVCVCCCEDVWGAYCILSVNMYVYTLLLHIIHIVHTFHTSFTHLPHTPSTHTSHTHTHRQWQVISPHGSTRHDGTSAGQPCYCIWNQCICTSTSIYCGGDCERGVLWVECVVCVYI